MKKFTGFLLILVLALLASPLFARGSSAGATEGSGAPVPISIFLGSHTRTWHPELPNNQELMRRTNTVLDVIITSNNNALNLLFASGDLPDLITFDELTFHRYLSTGYLRALDDLLRSHGQNLSRNIGPKAWELMTIEG